MADMVPPRFVKGFVTSRIYLTEMFCHPRKPTHLSNTKVEVFILGAILFVHQSNRMTVAKIGALGVVGNTS